MSCPTLPPTRPARRIVRFGAVGLLLGLALSSCLEPARPAFAPQDRFYLVEGRIQTGAPSEVRIRVSDFRSVSLTFDPVSGADVSSVADDGRRVAWAEVAPQSGAYRPPPEFSPSPGERWHLEATLPDGTRAVSDPEAVPAPAVARNLDVRFEQEAEYDEGRRRFIPRFELYLDYDDPSGVSNYYAYDYRYWEETVVCASCENGFYVNGACVPNPPGQPYFLGYDYACDSPECYTITPGNQARYGTDEFTDGLTVTGFPLGGIEFQALGGLLAEGQVVAISAEAYRYGRVIADLTTGSSGLNAVTPAALNGNVRNADPAGVEVLGYVAVAAFAATRTYFVRTPETGQPLPLDPPPRYQPVPPPGVPPLAPCDIPGRRTSVKPAGWP